VISAIGPTPYERVEVPEQSLRQPCDADCPTTPAHALRETAEKAVREAAVYFADRVGAGILVRIG
jgi:hypothetical protein